MRERDKNKERKRESNREKRGRGSEKMCGMNVAHYNIPENRSVPINNAFLLLPTFHFLTLALVERMNIFQVIYLIEIAFVICAQFWLCCLFR